MRKAIDRLKASVAIKNLFPKTPLLRFRSSLNVCSCGTSLNVRKTRKRCIKTLLIGTFHAVLTQLFCPGCQLTYGAESLRRLVPQQSNVGYDVLAFVGTAFFWESRPQLEIQQTLAQRGVNLSLREIGYLAKKFVVYLSLAHQEAAEGLRRQMVSRGGYILHLDGTLEVKGTSPYLLSALDGLTGMVLGNAKVHSESQANFIPFLRRIKAEFGDPIALVHDMGSGLMSAVEQVFPNTPDFICHFHFLRDLGKDLIKTQYQMLIRQIKTLRIRPKLREAARRLKQLIEAEPHHKACLQNYLETMPSSASGLPAPVSAYLLIMWVLEVAATLKGYGIPFDRADLDFFHRLQAASPMIRRWLPSRKSSGPLCHGPLYHLGHLLDKIAADKMLTSLIKALDQKACDFDLFRDAMRIALPNGPHGLNDEGLADDDLGSIRERVYQWCQLPRIQKLAVADPGYRKALKQIRKYERHLFGDPIEVNTPHGPLLFQPQRTNNLMERFFREFKRKNRKRNGFSSVAPVIRAMITDTPLVKNLENPQYLEALLAGSPTLADRFADIDIKMVREHLASHRSGLAPGSAKLRRLARIPDLPARLSRATSASVAA